MKKNYIAIFRKADDLIGILVLITFLVVCSNVAVFAQNSPLFANNNTALFSSQKGPFDPISANEEVTLDALPPVITYTPLTSICTTGNRTLTATITDADGVPTSGLGLPVLYWQINSGIFIPVTGVSIGGNQYTFTFGAAALPGNLVSYYIVAQDNVGNVIAKPSAGAAGYTTSPPAVATDPSSPDFYVVQTTLTAGTYTVGAGGAQNYLTITDAVNAYNNSCLSGAVTFLLMDANYDASEVFPITISNPAASAANTLTIKPNTGINTLIQGTANDAIFKFNGADYVTIEGSNSGGATRNLTITNNSTNLSSVVIWLGSANASNGASNNTIKNCIVTGNAGTTTLAGIASSSGVIPGNIAEAANSNNTYLNNSINTSYYGILVYGPAGGDAGTVISTNTVGSTLSSKKLGYRGIYVSNQTGMQVSNNTVQGIVSTIGIGSDIEPTGGIVVAGSISGGNVFSNFINDVKNSNVAGWPSYGISLQATSTVSGIKIYNNMIHSIAGHGNVTEAGNNGIGIALVSGGGYGIYFNSVNQFANQTISTGGISSAIFIGPGITTSASVDIRNNIFSNRRTTGTNYAIYCSVANIIFSNINFNDYYSTTFLGYLGSDRANIAAWQAATALDGNSVAANPIFTSTTDLHLQLISPLNDQGSSISGITTDIDATVRSGTVPDIGCDEFTPPACSGNTGGTAVSDFITVCTSGSVSLSASGFSYGLGISYQWEKATNIAGPYTPIAGETNPTSSNPPVIAVTTYYRLRVICSAGAPGYSNVLAITVYNPSILTTTPGSRCGPGTVNLAATGTPTTAIQWYADPTGGAPLFIGSPFTTPVIAANTTYYAESTYLGSSGTVGLTNPSGATGISTQLTSWQVYFDVIQATKLLTVDVFPAAAGEVSTLDVYNSSNAIIGSVTYTTTVGGGATPQTVTLNVSLPIGNGYYLYATNGLPTSGLTRNLTGAVYPYNSTDIVITGNEFNQNFYMCYYRWRFSNGCSSSPRTAVTATVGATSTITATATPAAICAGSSSNLSATSSNSSFVYTWTPGSLVGANQTVSPAATTTYTVNATDGTCTGTANVTVTVNPASSNVVIAPATITKCASAPAVLLTATGGDIVGVPIISENFNGATNSWVALAIGSTGSVAACAWTLRPDGYVASGQTIHSNDNSQVYLSHSDANTPGFTRTTLTSPAFSLVGYTTANLNFWHTYQYFGSTSDSANVEISQNGSTWTSLAKYKSTKGGSTNFANVNISLDAYVGQATNYIRFRYSAKDDIFWAIDNVTITGGNTGSPITWAPLTGLFTDPAGTIAYTGTVTATVYASPTVTTTYTATATPVNACQKTETIDVTINSVGAVISGSTAVCPSGAAPITVTLTGTAPWSITYTDGTTPVTVNNILTSPYVFTVNPLVTTTYTVSDVSDANCTAIPAEISGSAVITVSATLFSTWVGINSDWTDPVNWCGGVPTNSKDVVIPVTPNSPVIAVLTAVSRDISISTGASLTINSGAVFSFKGNFVNDGTIINNGTIVLNGSTAQTFPGGTTGTVTAMNILEVNNAAGANINKSIAITGTLKPTAGIITLLNDTITLRSTATNTARVSALGGTAGFVYNGTGKFSVERFISSATRTGWRFLAAPITTSSGQTINQAWQEGQAAGVYTATGYGMQIVGPASAGPGFDVNTTTSSLKTYNPATNTWVSVPGTLTPLISSTGGYMTFIRGDRGANTLGAMSATSLRVAGAINTGAVGPFSTASANTFISLGNPYPSAIDFSTTTRNGLQDVYYLWDPKLGVYGAYQTFTGPGYNATPGGGSYTGGNKFIESGQAFFVVSNAAAVPHNISFAESNKVASTYQVQRISNNEKRLATRLYAASGANFNLTDGTLVEFDAAYTNAVDDMDAPKLSNFGENIGIINSNKIISVERRAEIIDTDTLFYQLGQLKQIGYQLEFTAENLAEPGLTAYLEDSYLHTSTVISLNAVSLIDFNVNADPASSASNRFRLVFRQLIIVPVTFTNVIAYRQEKNIIVNWKVENELNIDHYEVERSTEGRNFSKIGEQAARNNGSASQEYDLVDEAPFAGDNFYRIRSVGVANDIKFSEIVKVTMDDAPSLITIYPNPVKDGIIGISFNNQPEGMYDLKLSGVNGQLLMKQKIYHPGGSQRINVPLATNYVKGVYTLEILSSNTKRRIFKVVLE